MIFGVVRNSDPTKPCHVFQLVQDGYGAMTASCHCGEWKVEGRVTANTLAAAQRAYRGHLLSLKHREGSQS